MTLIYHITHVANLPAVLAQDGLWCDRESAQQGLAAVGIAHAHIKERRANRVVRLGPGGTLADYVPLYFAPRSPMLYAIHRNQVAGYRGGQADIVHLVSSAETVQAAGLPFVFTDGHADMEISSFFTNLNDLNHLDWRLMDSKYWHDTSSDGDRKRRRQAEFLVHRFFPWSLVTEVGVINRTAAERVHAALPGAAHVPVVSVHRDWYY